jgi:hypothetical protein
LGRWRRQFVTGDVVGARECHVVPVDGRIWIVAGCRMRWMHRGVDLVGAVEPRWRPAMAAAAGASGG